MDFKEYEKGIPEDFKSDGCTLAPDGSWGSCCRIHDHALRNKDVSDHAADVMLHECMQERANPIIAFIYFMFVRLRSLSGMGAVGFTMLAAFISLVIFLIFFG